MHPLVASYVFMGLLVVASLVHGEFDELAQPSESYELTQPAVEPIEDDLHDVQNAGETVPNRYLPALPLGGSSPLATVSRDDPVDNPATVANVSNPVVHQLENGVPQRPDEHPITTLPDSPQQVNFGDEPVHSTSSPIGAKLTYSPSSSSDDDSVSDEPDYEDTEESSNASNDEDEEEKQSSAECVDHAENCAANVDYCQEHTYKPLMEYYCAKSCSYCPKVRPPLVLITSAGAEVRAQCEDSSPRCASWNEHRFCSSKFFLPEIKQRFCARTCGLCPDDQPATASHGGTGAIIDTSAASSVTARRNKGERKVFSWRRGAVPHRAYRHRDHSPKDTLGRGRAGTTESHRPSTNRYVAPVLDGESEKSKKPAKNNAVDEANRKRSKLLAEETTASSKDDRHEEVLPIAATAIVPLPPHFTEPTNTFNESEKKESQTGGDGQALHAAPAAVVPTPPHATELPSALNESEKKESLKEENGQALITAAAAEEEAGSGEEKEKIKE